MPFGIFSRRSQWPRTLRQVLSSAARTLGSQVRILLGAWMCVCVSLCVGRGLGAGLIPHPRGPTKYLRDP
jgi:hypothetical protein